MTRRSEDPYRRTHVDIAGTHENHLAGARPGELLELHHGPNLRAQVFTDRIYMLDRHWRHRSIFFRLTPTATETID